MKPKREYSPQFLKWPVDMVEERLKYIEGINPFNPGSDFKHKTVLFLQYCDMVEWHFNRSNYPYTAARVRHIAETIRKELGHGTNKTI